MDGQNNKISIEEQRLIYKEKVYPIAKEERQRIVSDENVIKDTFSILEQLGFFILRFPGKDKNLSGFHIKKSGYHCIYINTCQTLGRQYFSAWHEYYHAVTGDGAGVSLLDEKEKDLTECKAELFAGYMLMPEELIFKYIKDNKVNLRYMSDIELIKMQNYFRVSYTAMVRRLQMIFPQYPNLINLYALSSEERHEELVQKTIEAKGDINIIEPSNDFYVSKKFYEDIKMNLSNNRISKEKAYNLEILLSELNYNDR